MGNPDTIFHDLANQDPTGLARLLLGDSSVTAEATAASLPIVRARTADALLLVRPAQDEFLLHAECTLGRLRIGPRMLEYVAILARREHRRARKEGRPERPIVSAVLRLRGSRRPPRSLRHEVRGTNGLTVVFQYLEINMQGLEAEDLLASSDPTVWSLVSLARGGDRREVLERAVSAIEKADLSPDQRAALFTSIWVFASVVGSHKMVERLLDMRGLRDTPALRQIFEEGRAEGEARGRAQGEAAALSKVLRTRLSRLGAPSPALERKIDAVTTSDELQRLVDIALDTETLAEFRKRAFPRKTR